MPREVQQDAVLGAGEVHRLSGQLDLPRQRIDLQVADGDAGLLVRLHVRSAQNRLDAADELARRERLGHVVVGAELEAQDAVDLVAARRQHDDRDAGVRAQVAGDVEAGLAGQHDVEDDQVGLDLREDELAAGRVARGVDLVASLRERVVHDLEDRLLVIDDQYAFDRHGPP